MIKRHEVFEWFKEDFGECTLLFKSLSDEYLAEHYGLSVFRKGYFNRA